MNSADFFYQQGQLEFALQILSNINEFGSDRPELIRIVAYKLKHYGELNLSKTLLREVVKLRPEETRSYQDLAFIQAELGQYSDAINVLYSAAFKRLERSDEYELIALFELSGVIKKAKKAGVSKFNIDPRLIKLIDIYDAIVVEWYASFDEAISIKSSKE